MTGDYQPCFPTCKGFVQHTDPEPTVQDECPNINQCGCPMPGAAFPAPQTCAMSKNGLPMVVKNDTHQETWPACKPASPSVPGQKHQDKPKAGSPFLVILTAEQARTIYFLRSASTAEDFHSKFIAGKSSLVAEMFGVSPKTIRDVWNRKTWTQASPALHQLNTHRNFNKPLRQVTRFLWSEEESCLYKREHMTLKQRAAAGDTEPLVPKRRGRPAGSKDARPRKRRSHLLDSGNLVPSECQSAPSFFLSQVSFRRR